ncbi:DSBA oxidoreductase [Salinisphaera japonica YTM-1]|uniref:DSBA oxidoreductase n=2 Tax=Salinisphaera TaxID=180541 RepID=A0A423PT61_9GAMM|nr:DSBA oxidoreductase [Salinisphaera japonica YTM-1]
MPCISATALSSMAEASEPRMAGYLLAGLAGVLLACIAADINAQATTLAMADIRGHLGVGIDRGSWFETLFSVGEVMGMLVAPWLAIAFSMRRFAAFATLMLAVLSLGCAAVNSPELFYGLRYLQGLSTGFLIPLLMTVALRFLTPSIKLFGLAAYALTATFAPNFGAPVVAWAHQVAGYDAIYLSVVPVAALAFGLIVYGIPQDPLRLERFKQLDWIGLILGWTAGICIVTLFSQGERLDWLHSPMIDVLAIVGSVSLVVFVWHECYHPVPFIWPQLLLRPNFAFGTIMLFGFIVLGFAFSNLPSRFLSEVHGYRPAQTMPVAMIVALPPLVLLPAVSWLLNFKRVDARWCLVVGLVLVATTCLLYTQVSPDWIRHNFYLGQSIAVVGQALVVVSLLMLATGVVAPQEGPYAAATINVTRALAAPIGTGVLDWFLRVRSDTHSHALLDRIGAHRYELAQSTALTGHDPAPMRADGASASAMSQFASHIQSQAQTLALADGWQLMLVLAVGLLMTCVITERVYPPRLKIPPGT